MKILEQVKRKATKMTTGISFNRRQVLGFAEAGVGIIGLADGGRKFVKEYRRADEADRMKQTEMEEEEEDIFEIG